MNLFDDVPTPRRSSARPAHHRVFLVVVFGLLLPLVVVTFSQLRGGAIVGR